MQVDLYLQVQMRQVCQTANTCADCARAASYCGWALAHPSFFIKWNKPKCIVAPLWDWEYGPENVITETSSCPTTTTITTTRPVCPKCGTFKKDGKVSCCAPGGAWFKKCGIRLYDYTWGEGIDACKGQCALWASCGSARTGKYQGG